MKKNWLALTTFAIGVAFLQLVACAKFLDSRNAVSSSNALAPLQPVTQAIAERDFSAALEPCQPRWVDRATSQELPPFDWKLASRPIGLGDLPKPQQLQLGGYVAPNGKYVDIGWMFITTQRFKNEFGRLPQSGLEIVHWLHSNTPRFAGEDLNRLSPESMPKWFYKFVNPQTGKLYRSFDGSVPEPGGVKIREIVDVEDAKRAFAGRAGADLYTHPRCIGGYEIIVSDTDPSKILDTTVILHNVDLETDEAPAKVYESAEEAQPHLHSH